VIDYLTLLAGFVVLIKGADFLVEGAASMARRLRVSDLVIGLTVVAFGTSSPELFVNVVSSLRGNTEIAIGNVLGSNIANTLLILGVCSVIYPLTVTTGTVWKEIPLSLLAAIVLGAMANDRYLDGGDVSALTRSEGLVLLSFFVIFMYYSAGIARRLNGMEALVPSKVHGWSRSLLLVLLGLVGLTVGGSWIVKGAVGVATRLGMSQSLVGLTIVAVGTSLPELATSAMAAYRRNAEIAVGNVVGSNIFNIFFVLGISSVINPLPLPPGSNLDLGMVLFASALLLTAMFTGKTHRLDRWEGGVFLVLYMGYLVLLVVAE